MRLIRVTFTMITEAQASDDHTRSMADHRCLAHWVILTQHRNANDILASDEQAGKADKNPETAGNPTILPTRSVPRSHATSVASTSKMVLAKNWNSKRLHSMGTVIARRIRAPRRRSEPPFANSRI